MHGSVGPMEELAPKADIFELEPSSSRYVCGLRFLSRFVFSPPMHNPDTRTRAFCTVYRSALHKAAFWGHVEAVGYLVNVDKAGSTLNIQDYNGDTALHDAARFGHLRVCQVCRA